MKKLKLELIKHNLGPDNVLLIPISTFLEHKKVQIGINQT
jgi:hypothetical protein